MKTFTRTINSSDRPVQTGHTSSQGAAAGIITKSGHTVQITGFPGREPDLPDTFQITVNDEHGNNVLDVLQPLPDEKPTVTASGQMCYLAEALLKRLKETEPDDPWAIEKAQEAKGILLELNVHFNQRNGNSR